MQVDYLVVDHEAVHEGVFMSEVVIRQPVRRLHAEARRAEAFDDLPKTAAGIGMARPRSFSRRSRSGSWTSAIMVLSNHETEDLH
jgi:hypothetical protein